MSEVSLAQLVGMVTGFCKGLREGKLPAAAMPSPARQELIEEYNRLLKLAFSKRVDDLPGGLSSDNEPTYGVLITMGSELEAAVTPAKDVDKVRGYWEYSEAERAEAHRIAKILIEKSLAARDMPLPVDSQGAIPPTDEAEVRRIASRVTAFCKGLREGKPPAAAMLDPAPRELIERYNRLRKRASDKDKEYLPGELILLNNPSFFVLMVLSAVLEGAVMPARVVTMPEVLTSLDEEIQKGNRPSMLEKLKELSEKNRSK